MENFIIGCLTTIVFVAIIKRTKRRVILKRIGFRQSILHHIIKDMLPTNNFLNSQKDRQSKKYRNAAVIKVIQAPDNKAYWVKDNIFYYAEVIDGEFDPTTGKPVDTNDLSRKEIDKLLFILDNLKSQNG
jgi:hypothetical protein